MVPAETKQQGRDDLPAAFAVCSVIPDEVHEHGQGVLDALLPPRAKEEFAVLETRLEIELDGQHGPVANLGRIEAPIGAQLSLQLIGLFPAGLDVARVLVSWSVLNLMFTGTTVVCDTPSTAKQIFFGVAYLAMLGDHGREVDGWIHFACGWVFRVTL